MCVVLPRTDCGKVVAIHVWERASVALLGASDMRKIVR